MTSTIIIEEKQLNRLMQDKIKYKKPYYKVIEGYQKLIDKLKLREELDMIMLDEENKKEKEREKNKK